MIVKMAKLRLIGLLEERNAIVRRLMKLGVVELRPIELGDDNRAVTALTEVDDATARITEIEEELRRIRTAITFLEGKLAGKRPPKKDMTYDTFVNPDTYRGAWQKVFDVNDLRGRIIEVKSRLGAIANTTARLAPWQKLDLRVDTSSTATCDVLFGTLPVSCDVDGTIAMPLAEITIVSEDADYKYCCIIAHREARQGVLARLNENGFIKADFGVTNGTPSSNMTALQRETDELNAQLSTLESQAVTATQGLPLIYSLYDYIYNMQERRRVRPNIIKTDKTFLVGGYLPIDEKETIKRALNTFTVSVEFEDCAKDEPMPVLLRNNPVVTPFEVITEMYSLPRSDTIDPCGVMSPFFFIFFGMMLSDAGYGLALILGCGYAMWKMRLEGAMDKLVRLMFICGFSTFVFGALFGGWFGNLLPAAFGLPVGPLWFDPVADPMRLLFISIALGGVHIVTGMAVKAYMLIRDGDILGAIFDVGFWWVFLGGITLLVTDMFGVYPNTFGLYLAAGGAVGLILTQGRSEKNIFMKLFNGVASLYNITGYLSDILSYARLLALGLATGVIGTVFNTLGLMGGGTKSFFGILLLAVVVLVGHGFNLAINVLGSYVHASRLQYIEFYGKFYETGGEPFKPLKTKTKYLYITK